MKKCSFLGCNNTFDDHVLTTCPAHSDTCPVCLEKLGVADETATLRCGHMFHACCIYQWFDSNLNCPMCRLKIRSE